MNKMIFVTLVALAMMPVSYATTVDDLISKGNTYWSQGKMDLAESEFKKALEIDSKSSAAYARVANLYLTQNKAEAASKQFQNAIINDPENPKLYLGLAITYLHLQYHQMAEAMVNHAIKLDPDMLNAQKLKTYMDAKKEVVASAPLTKAMPMNATHGNTNSSLPPIIPTSHSQTNVVNDLPATLKNRIQKDKM